MMNLDIWLKRGALAAGLLGAVAGAAAFSGLPAKVKDLEKSDLSTRVELKVVRTQLNWLTKTISQKWKVEPPDLSEFEKEEPDARRR